MNNKNLLSALATIDNLTNLSEKEKNCLRLLTDEMFSMSSILLKSHSKVEFDVVNEGTEYSLCLKINAQVGEDEKAAFLSLSPSRKNKSTQGLKGKIAAILECFAYSPETATEYTGYNSGGFDDFLVTWSLESYRNSLNAAEEQAEWDGLEKSIILNFADDVIIGALHNKVEMIVKKNFA